MLALVVLRFSLFKNLKLFFLRCVVVAGMVARLVTSVDQNFQALDEHMKKEFDKEQAAKAAQLKELEAWEAAKKAKKEAAKKEKEEKEQKAWMKARAAEEMSFRQTNPEKEKEKKRKHASPHASPQNYGPHSIIDKPRPLGAFSRRRRRSSEGDGAGGGAQGGTGGGRERERHRH